MNEFEIRALVIKLDTNNVAEREVVWQQLREYEERVVPYLKEVFLQTKRANARAAMVFHATQYARSIQDSFDLGVLALADAESRVRYQACALCAFSMRREALPHLRELLRHTDSRTVASAKAAIVAIQTSDHQEFAELSR